MFTRPSIGNYLHRQLTLQIRYHHLILPIHTLPIIDTYPKTVSTHAPQFRSMKSLMLRNFPAVMMPFSAISAPNLVTDSLNLGNSNPTLPQIPQDPQFPQTDISTLIVHRQYGCYRNLPMDWPGRSYLISPNGYFHFIPLHHNTSIASHVCRYRYTNTVELSVGIASLRVKYR